MEYPFIAVVQAWSGSTWKGPIDGSSRIKLLNWIVWNGTVFEFEIVHTLNWLFELELFDGTELLKIEVFLTIELCTHTKLIYLR